MKTVCLNMIVKNEAKNLPRLFDSVKDFIDYFVIVDTGSADNTKEVIEEFKKTIPGELYEMEWKNFGWNRSQSIKLTKGKSDFVLLLDADDTIHIDNINEFKNNLKGDGYHIHHNGNLDFTLPRLINANYDWSFVGVTHEYITCPQEQNFIDQRELTITHHADGGCRLDKFTRDIKLLEQGIIDEPHNSRYYFYLAQSYKDVGDWKKAIENYKKRSEMGGWMEEIYYSIYQHIRGLIALDKNGNNESEILTLLLKGFVINPKRAEALYEVIRYYRVKEQYQKALVFASHAYTFEYPYSQKLFIEKEIYDWKLLDEVAIVQYWVGNFTQCKNDCEKLLKSRRLPIHQVPRISNHIKFCEEQMSPK